MTVMAVDTYIKLSGKLFVHKSLSDKPTIQREPLFKIVDEYEGLPIYKLVFELRRYDE